ncbi:hypothetical protein PG987_005611 [Apiospora arundinis]
MQTTSTLGAITTSIATTADATRTICDDTPTDATPTGAVSVSGSLFFGFDSPSNDSGLSPLYSCDQCCVERTFNSTTDPEWDNTPYASAIDCVQLRDSIIHKRYVGGMETKITQHVKGDGFPVGVGFGTCHVTITQNQPTHSTFHFTLNPDFVHILDDAITRWGSDAGHRAGIKARGSFDCLVDDASYVEGLQWRIAGIW